MEHRARHQGWKQRQAIECGGRSPAGSCGSGAPRLVCWSWIATGVGNRASGHGRLSSLLPVPSEQTQSRRCARRPAPTQNFKAADGPHQASDHPPAASTHDRDRKGLSEQRTRPSRKPTPGPGPGPGPEQEIATNSYTPLAPRPSRSSRSAPTLAVSSPPAKACHRNEGLARPLRLRDRR